MNQQVLRVLAVSGAIAVTAFGQPRFERQARIVGGGGPDQGKCTIEVVVDDVVRVEVRGTTAVLRTLSGRPGEWRRFECTSPMPLNPREFRFAGVDGRGRQTLVGDPRQGGPAVVEIVDRDGGAEGYTFDLFWGREDDRRGPSAIVPPPPPPYRDGDDGDRNYRPGYRDSDYYRRYHHGFGVDEAVRICQDAVMSQAQRRFRTRDIHFDRTRIDDGPGRQDWVIGTIDVPRRNEEERYRFSCSVDFGAGRIRSADIDPRPIGDERRR